MVKSNLLILKRTTFTKFLNKFVSTLSDPNTWQRDIKQCIYKSVI